MDEPTSQHSGERREDGGQPLLQPRVQLSWPKSPSGSPGPGSRPGWCPHSRQVVAAERDRSYTLLRPKRAPIATEELSMPARLLHRLITISRAAGRGLSRRLLAAARPAVVPLAAGTLADLARSKPALMAENAFLRHQLVMLHRR